MKKSILALTAISFLAGNLAFANTNTNNNHPKHNPEFHKAIGECMAEAGIKKPEFKKDGKPEFKKDDQTKAERTPNTDRPEPPKDAQGNPVKPPFAHGKHPHGKHPKFEMTDEQRTKVDACLTKKGVAKPEPRSK